VVSDNQVKISCLFVHGWGMNHTIWQPVIEQLPQWIDAHVMDLPGHGQRQQQSLTDLQGLTRDLQQQCASVKKKGQPLMVVGWSLGALPCMNLLAEQASRGVSDRHLKDIDALIMVSTNPCFVSRENWDCGIDAEIFNQFAESLKADFSGTIRRFLSLQVKGSASGRIILRSLREKVLQQPVPDQSSLDAGLQILKQVDLRLQIKHIEQPVKWILGGQDGLVKVELADALAELMKQANVQIIEKSGHAPFLSHTENFTQQLVEFAQSALMK